MCARMALVVVERHWGIMQREYVFPPLNKGTSVFCVCVCVCDFSMGFLYFVKKSSRDETYLIKM